MTFKSITTVCAAIFATLAVTLWCAPQIIYILFEVDGAPIGDFMAKRAASLFVGLTTLCVLARNSQSPEVQRIVATSLGLGMAVMAVTGTYEVLRGFAGAGIWPAIIAEIVITAAYVRVLRQG